MPGSRPVPSHAEGTPFEMPVKGYLTDAELAPKLTWSPKTLESKVRAGVFIKGVHYFQPPGMRRRWKWSAVVEWLEGCGDQRVDDSSIPLASPAEGRVS